MLISTYMYQHPATFKRGHPRSAENRWSVGTMMENVSIHMMKEMTSDHLIIFFKRTCLFCLSILIAFKAVSTSTVS